MATAYLWFDDNRCEVYGSYRHMDTVAMRNNCFPITLKHNVLRGYSATREGPFSEIDIWHLPAVWSSEF